MTLALDFSGKTVLITGATRGIGQALAHDFYAAGADLILTGTNPDTIAELERANAEAGIKNIRYIQADFSDEASLQAFLDKIGRCPRIDACINNAGTNKNNPIYEIVPDDYDRIAQVNLRAPLLICRKVCQLMQATRYGRMVNIASIWSVISKAGRAVYSTTKAGLVGMTRVIAVDMAPYNVLVNAVSPGFVMTELTQATLSPQDMKELAAQVPLNRFAQPEEITKIVLFLASDLNTYLTGQNIIIDGGFSNV